MSYNKIKFAVGLFVIIFVFTVSALMFFLMREKGVFDKSYTYNFTAKSAESFSVGMPLKFSGFNIGVIDKMSLTDEGKVYMEFSVNEKNRKWINQNTTLIIKKPLIGSPHIDVHSTAGNVPLPVDSSLNIFISDDIDDMIETLKPTVEKLQSIIDSVEIMASKIVKDDSDFSQTLKNIRIFSEKLAQSDSLLENITGEKTSSQNLVKSMRIAADTMQQLKEISQKANELVASLEGKIIDPTSSTIKSLDNKIIEPSSNVVNELEGIMKDVKKKLDTLNSTVEALGSYDKDLINLKEQLNVGIEKSNQIMDKVDALMQDEKKDEVTLP